MGHIRLGDEADLIVVAPASADAIARLAAGTAGDLLTAVVLASRAPVLLAPAMNVNMWQNPLTQQNLGRLLGLNRFRTVGPDAGELACGWIGEGRLVEPAEILAAASSLLAPQDLAGQSVVVTAGPDLRADRRRPLPRKPVVGKDGLCPGAGGRAARSGGHVDSRPRGAGDPPRGRDRSARRRDGRSAAGAALNAVAPTADVVVMAAAVADFRAAAPVAGKLSRRVGRPANRRRRRARRARRRDPASTPTALPLSRESRSAGRARSQARKGSRPSVAGRLRRRDRTRRRRRCSRARASKLASKKLRRRGRQRRRRARHRVRQRRERRDPGLFRRELRIVDRAPQGRDRRGDLGPPGPAHSPDRTAHPLTRPTRSKRSTARDPGRRAGGCAFPPGGPARFGRPGPPWLIRS
jgi:hypothetical protein